MAGHAIVASLDHCVDRSPIGRTGPALHVLDRWRVGIAGDLTHERPVGTLPAVEWDSIRVCAVPRAETRKGLTEQSAQGNRSTDELLIAISAVFAPVRCQRIDGSAAQWHHTVSHDQVPVPALEKAIVPGHVLIPQLSLIHI